MRATHEAIDEAVEAIRDQRRNLKALNEELSSLRDQRNDVENAIYRARESLRGSHGEKAVRWLDKVLDGDGFDDEWDDWL